MPIDSAARKTVICFDLGGVLVEICRSWHQACGLAGVEVRPVPHDFEHKRRRSADLHQLGRISDERYFADVEAASAGSYSAREVEAVHHAWTLREYPGIAALIDALRADAAITLACLSNTNAPHWSRLAKDAPAADLEYPSLAHLEIRLASHLMGLAKPDPSIYAAATERFGGDASRVVFFDDLPENVGAARSAGWQAHRIDPDGDPAKQMQSVLAARELC